MSCRALLAGDVNNDGYEDLVMGAPSYGVGGNFQQGRVYIVYGTIRTSFYMIVNLK